MTIGSIGELVGCSFEISDSKNRERIYRRTRAALYRQRRKRDHELVASQPSCSFDGTLEVEILHNAYAHPLHDHLMNWVAGNALGRTQPGRGFQSILKS